ncbi:MAG: hypothetical protein AB1733_10635 [Thermodesulfobacteriota bacterium]
MKVWSSDTKQAEIVKVVSFFLLVFAHLWLLGRIGVPLAHDYFDSVVMRDTCLLVAAFIERGAVVSASIVEAMKHIEGPLVFVLMNLYVMAIGDALALTPATMYFLNTLLVLIASAFAFSLMRRLFARRTAYCTVLAFVLTPWIGHVIRLTQYFNALALALQFSTVYFLVRFAREPENRFWRVVAPLSIAAYLFSSLDWPSFFLFLGLFWILSGQVRSVLRNPYNVFILAGFAVILIWDLLLFFKFGVAGLPYTRLLYAFAVSSTGAAFATLKAIWENEILGWGPLLVVAFSGLAFYIVTIRRSLSHDTVTRGLLDALGLWLLWATFIVFCAAGHPTYLYVLGMPAAVFSGLILARIPIKPLVAAVLALGVFQLGAVTDWGFGTKTDERRRVLAAACFLIQDRPDLLTEDKALLAVDCQRLGRNGLGGAVAQYARPRKRPIIMPNYFPATGRIGSGFGWNTQETLSEIVQTYEKTGVLKADGLILESAALAPGNPGAHFWERMTKDPNIRWIARFTEHAGEIFIGVPAGGDGTPLERAKQMDVQTLSDRYLAQYDRLSFLVQNLEHVRLYFTSGLSKPSSPRLKE